MDTDGGAENVATPHAFHVEHDRRAGSSRPAGRDLGSAGAMTTDPAELERVADATAEMARQMDFPSEHSQRLATLGTIAGLIAHEFNNLLTPVLSYAQMALADPDNRELSVKALQRTVAGAERASQIATAILGFVRDDAVSNLGGPGEHGCSTGNATGSAAGRSGHASELCGGPSLPEARVLPCVHEALTCLARDLKSDGVTLSVDVDAALAAMIKPVALQHVLMNLILNARKATPAGGRITVRATRHAGAPPASRGVLFDDRWISSRDARASQADTLPVGTPLVCVEVVDTGCGMSPEQARRVFTPFFTNGDRSSTPINQTISDRRDAAARPERRRGTGLGMTICKRLVEDARGEIRLLSAPGQGTTVRVILPEAPSSGAIQADAA